MEYSRWMQGWLEATCASRLFVPSPAEPGLAAKPPQALP
jgi:hypothetical protein